MVAWLPGGLLEGFVVWCMGLVVHASVGRLGRGATAATIALGAICFAGSLAYAKSAALQAAVGLSPDLMVGLGFSLLAIGLVNRPNRRSPWPRFDTLSRIASEFSYSLYLIHFPIVALVGGTLYHAGKRLPDLQGLAGFFAWLAVLLAVGYAFYWAFERHTETVRRKVESMLAKRG